MSDPRRRASDKKSTSQIHHGPLDITAMIMEEDDPKNRAFLIILNSINVSLIANTTTIKEVSEKLEQHLTNFETHAANETAMMNKGRGAWRVAAWVIGIAQIVGLGIWQQARTDLANINSAIQAVQTVDAQQNIRITILEQNHK